MCTAGISHDNLFNYQLLNECQASASTQISSQINPGKKVWTEKLEHIGNISSEFIKQKWEGFPALQDALIKTDYSRHFESDPATYQKILECQKTLREIDLCFVGDILALHYDKSSLNHITPELKEKIKEIEATTDLFSSTLSDIKKSDRIIHGEATQKCFFSRRLIVGIALSVVGIALAATAFVLPIAIPVLVISAPLLLGALRGLGLLISCTDGSLNIRDAINKCTQKSIKMEAIEFTDTFSKLHDYLNDIKLIGMVSLAARKTESQALSDHNAFPFDTQKMITDEILKLQETVQQLQKEVDSLKLQHHIPSQKLTYNPTN
ncbi:MAG: hypothetical protein ACMZI0_17670 [Symbiopectobacterium sp.]|uniref:hypothetical protein n=1 Tax=Symbiopectobacterium sp. TaxID=2952789 RepID=UPI0039ECB60E